jgi:hypothetical protein
MSTKSKALLLIIVLGLFLVACGGARAPSSVTLTRDALLLQDGFDKEVIGQVPEGATCTFRAVTEVAGDVFVHVENCQKGGERFGAGAINGTFGFEESDQLWALLEKGR